MAGKVKRVTVNLTAYPDLVVIYLGMRANSLRGLKTLIQFGPRIQRAVDQKPDGLLLHENLILFAVPSACGSAPVLARLRIARKLGALAPAPGLVASLLTRFRRHRFLARSLFRPRRNGSYL